LKLEAWILLETKSRVSEFLAVKLTTPGDIMKTSQTEPLKILLVDDQPIALRALTIVLENLGELSDSVLTGEEAVIHAKNYNLILIDVSLPGLNGIEAVREIRRLENTEKPVYIVMLTAHTSKETEQKCLLAGANFVQIKPINSMKMQQILINTSSFFEAQC
jgi:CheY-like chemotaxis protein